MKQNLHIPCLLVWVIYPVAFTLLLVFCFMTCTGNKQNAEDKSPQEITAPK